MDHWVGGPFPSKGGKAGEEVGEGCGEEEQCPPGVLRFHWTFRLSRPQETTPGMGSTQKDVGQDEAGWLGSTRLLSSTGVSHQCRDYSLTLPRKWLLKGDETGPQW